MKIALSLASMGLASAFVEPQRGVARSAGRALRASDRKDDGNFVTKEIRDVRDVVSGSYVGGVWVPKNKGAADFLDTRVPPPSGFGNATPMPLSDGTTANPQTPRKSQALPFTTCPAALDGTLAGDVGFDPLGFADSYENLAKYREAEVKHGRLAMLAAAGWPLSELWDAKIAAVLDLEPALNPDGRVPSVLNGGMGRISITYWLGCLTLAAALDVYGSFVASKRDGYTAGDFGLRGFYPDGSFPKDQKGRERMQLAEIKHGRLAMVAITAFAAQEFVSHVPVVDHASLFFRPISEVLSSQVPGYYIPPDAVGDAAAVVAPAATAAVEAVTSAAVEATAVAPEIAVPAAVEAASSAVVEATSSAAVEAVAVAPEIAVPAAVEATAIVPPVAATTASTETAEELVAAKTRIVELEAKLAQINALIR